MIFVVVRIRSGLYTLGLYPTGQPAVMLTARVGEARITDCLAIAMSIIELLIQEFSVELADLDR